MLGQPMLSKFRLLLICLIGSPNLRLELIYSPLFIGFTIAYRSSVRLYSVLHGETGLEWTDHFRGPPFGSRVGEPARGFPLSEMLMRLRYDEFAIDVVPAYTASDLQKGRVYNVYFYNPEEEAADMEAFRYEHGLPPHINWEGPYKIRPYSHLDAIELFEAANQPQWVINRNAGRKLQDFRVIRESIDVFVAERGITGTRWLEERRPWSLRCIYFDRQIEYSVAAIRNKHDWSGRSILLYLVLYQRPKWIKEIYGADVPIHVGPWKVVPPDSDDIVLFEHDHQPKWISVEFSRALGRSLPVNDFHDFVVETAQEAEQPSTSRIVARAYQYTCMKRTIGYFVQPVDLVEEFIIPEPSGERTLIPQDEADTAQRTVSNYERDQLERDSMVESVEVYAQGKSRPVAQTIWTDHLDFQFSQAPSYGRSRDAASRSIFTMVCVYFLGGSMTVTFTETGPSR